VERFLEAVCRYVLRKRCFCSVKFFQFNEQSLSLKFKVTLFKLHNRLFKLVSPSVCLFPRRLHLDNFWFSSGFRRPPPKHRVRHVSDTRYVSRTQNNQKLLFTGPAKWKLRSLHPSPSSPVGTSESVYPNPLKRRWRFLPVQRRSFLFFQIYLFIFLSSTIAHEHERGAPICERCRRIENARQSVLRLPVVAVSRFIAHRRRFD